MFPPFNPSSQISSFVFSFKHRAKKTPALLIYVHCYNQRKLSYNSLQFAFIAQSNYQYLPLVTKWMFFLYYSLHSIKNMRICQLYNIMSVCQLYNIN